MIKETDIPRIYRTGKTKPAKNVGELIELLNALSANLKIYHGFAYQYIREKFPNTRSGDVRFNNYGSIEEEVNISCPCHPEYSWEYRASVDDFCEWLKTKGY